MRSCAREVRSSARCGESIVATDRKPVDLNRGDTYLFFDLHDLLRIDDRGVSVAWAKSRVFLEKIQLGSIILYLICLGGYAIPPVGQAFDRFQEAVHFKAVEIAGFTFFALFIASTILLSFEKDGNAEESQAAGKAG